MRRIGLPSIVPLLALLLFAEQGALLHELSHLTYGGQELGAQLRADGGVLDNARCATCQAFAQVAHPATGSPATCSPPAVGCSASPAPLYSIVSASAPNPRNRGPPQLLV